jgi:hypothetical protein
LQVRVRPQVAPPLQKLVVSQGAPSGQHLSQVLAELEAQSPALDTMLPLPLQDPEQQCPTMQPPALHSSSVLQVAARPFLDAHRLPLQYRFPLQRPLQQACPEPPQSF